MDILLQLDQNEERDLTRRKSFLNLRETRRLWILRSKLNLKHQLLKYDWPPRSPTDEEELRLFQLKSAAATSKHAPTPGSEKEGLWVGSEIFARIELFDDCEIISKDAFTPLARDHKYSLMMCKRYLRLSCQPNFSVTTRFLLNIPFIRSHQDALAVELSKRDTGIPQTSRVLAIADLITYIPVPKEVDKRTHEDCAICFEEFEGGIPEGADVQVVRDTSGGMINTSYIIRGTPSRLTHHTAQLPCLHYFGSRCIWKYFLDYSSCPYCRREYSGNISKYGT